MEVSGKEIDLAPELYSVPRRRPGALRVSQTTKRDPELEHCPSRGLKSQNTPVRYMSVPVGPCPSFDVVFQLCLDGGVRVLANV